MNLDSETYWMQRIGELQDQVAQLKMDKVDLGNRIHALGNEVTKKIAIIHDLETKIIELQKKEFHTNEY